MALTRDAVLDALKTLSDPLGDQDVVAAGLIRALTVADGAVRFVMEVDPRRSNDYEPLRAQAEELVKSLPGAEIVSVVMTAHSTPAAPPDLNPSRRAEPTGP